MIIFFNNDVFFYFEDDTLYSCDFTIIREAETKNIQTENNGCGWVGNREYNFKVILKYPLLPVKA